MSTIEVVSQTQTIVVDPGTQSIEVDSATGQAIVITAPSQSVSVINSGPQGPPGPTGPAGISASRYSHTQSIVSNVWNIAHNLGRKPSGIQVIDSGDNIIEGTIHHVDDNNLTLSFDSSFSGVANMI